MKRISFKLFLIGFLLIALVLTKRRRFGKVLVETERASNDPRYLRDLKRVRHTGTELLIHRSKKHLRLMHQPAEGLGMDDPVHIPLIAGAHIVLPEFISPGTPHRLVSECRQRIETAMLQ